MKETLEEAIKREYEVRKYNSDFPFEPQSFKLGAKWQQERMYSEEEVLKIIISHTDFLVNEREFLTLSDWFEQYKKK